MLVGLVLGLVGDIILGLDRFVPEEKRNFLLITGGTPFFLGHVAYIVVLASLSPLNLWLLPLFLVLPILILGMHKAFNLENNLVPFLFYSLVLGAMMVFTVNIALQGGPLGRLMILPGLLFTVSDSSLFLGKYLPERRGRPMPVLYYLVAIPYFTAQALFALSVSYL